LQGHVHSTLSTHPAFHCNRDANKPNITWMTHLPALVWCCAGLVVALRRSLKDLVGRAAGFVEEGVKLEQQMQQQVRGQAGLGAVLDAGAVQ
jgi:hypothetical protein